MGHRLFAIIVLGQPVQILRSNFQAEASIFSVGVRLSDIWLRNAGLFLDSGVVSFYRPLLSQSSCTRLRILQRTLFSVYNARSDDSRTSSGFPKTLQDMGG